MRATLLAALFTAILFLAPAGALPAVVSSAMPSLDLDPSVRAQGMGRASTAVFWGDDPNYWANPALLGYYKEIHYQWSRTRLAPDLASDVYFTTNRLTLGGWGLGLSIAGEPFSGLGGLKLDYGKFEGRDELGNPIGPLTAFEQIRSWGIGVSVVELTENAMQLAGWNLPSVSRFVDFSLGRSRNEARYFTGSLLPLGDKEIFDVRANTKDRGFVLRLTPYNSIGRPGFAPAIDSFLRPPFGGARLDLGYGESVHNYEDASVVWPWERYYIAKDEKRGLTVRLAIGFPGLLKDRLDSAGKGWLADLLTPLVSWGKAWDRTTASVIDFVTGERETAGEVRLSGWELTLGNVFAIRGGRIDEPGGIMYSGIHGETSGWSIGLQSAQLGGFRYDQATVPQTEGFKKLHPKGFSLWMNPLAVLRTVRGRTGPAALGRGH